MYHQLTSTQLKAVTTESKVVRLIAGAGSGKTRVLTTRIAHLIKNLNVDSYNILAITFTNKAAKEMKERISLMEINDNKATISTFHSLCFEILRKEINIINYPNNFTICDSDDQKSIIKKIYKDLDINKNDISYSSSLSYISNNKIANISPLKAKEFIYDQNDELEVLKIKIYQEYENYLNNNYLLDFDDLIIKTVAIFNQFPDVLNKYAKRYQYILVDEFQDIDHLQYQLVKQLSSYHQNIYIVGDPDQTIYTWRGSDVAIILNFVKDFKDVETIVLDENFRSCSNILNAANSVIKNNNDRVEKNLFTNNPKGDKIVYASFRQDELEANYIVSKIEKLKSEDINYNDIVILYRANYQSRIIEKALIENRIPYIIYGGIRFYERLEIKDILSYLRMLVNPDDLAFIRTINTPKRGVGAKALGDLEKMANSYDLSLYEAAVRNFDNLKNKGIKNYVEIIEILKSFLDKIDLEDLINKVLDLTGYRLMISTANEEERLGNIKELIKDIIEYQKNYPESNLQEYLQVINLYTDKESDNQQEMIKLMTIHSVKGLEFDNVFIMGMNEGVFPSERSLKDGIKGLEEERRLAYVAYTRAKKRLFLTETSGFNHITGKEKTPSRFINEIDEKYLININKEISSNLNNIINNSDTKVIYKKGDAVYHNIFKDGIVVSVESGILNIAFKYPYGIKKIKSGHHSISKKR